MEAKFEPGDVIKYTNDEDTDLRGTILIQDTAYVISWSGSEQKPLSAQSIEHIDGACVLDDKHVRNKKMNDILGTDQKIEVGEIANPYEDIINNVLVGIFKR